MKIIPAKDILDITLASKEKVSRHSVLEMRRLMKDMKYWAKRGEYSFAFTIRSEENVQKLKDNGYAVHDCGDDFYIVRWGGTDPLRH